MDTMTSPYDSVADAADAAAGGGGRGGDGVLRKSFEDLDATDEDEDIGNPDAPPPYSPPPPPVNLPREYHREFPYLSTTPIASYRPRSMDTRLNLIPRRDLLDMDL